MSARESKARLKLERDEALAEVERLRAVLRQTHVHHCDESWTSRGLHAPECLLSEVEP